jgi:hypothetical protein
MTHSIAWDQVTHADVLRALKEYDRLGGSGFSLSMVSPRLRRTSWSGRNAATRRKQSWDTAYELATGERLGSGEFEGGKSGAVKVLGKLGFTVQPKRRTAK